MGCGKHTPGTWVVNGQDVRDGAQQIVSLWGDPIADSFTMMRAGECEENANLIAAAPDMLQALEAVEWWGVEPDHKDKTFASACLVCGRLQKDGKHEAGCFIGNALKKARGEI